MGSKTKIDWADATWNPVTGCLHGCEYCYARRIARRFGDISCDDGQLHVQAKNVNSYEDAVHSGPYPFGFSPTFHRNILSDPKHWKKPRTIFVCSMADLFGEWVPDEWIRAVFEACEAAPQHRYIFLTKNPARLWPAHANWNSGTKSTTDHISRRKNLLVPCRCRCTIIGGSEAHLTTRTRRALMADSAGTLLRI